jgi:hypothetical protein
MRTFELIIVAIVLSGCAGFIGWALRDLTFQIKMLQERCESLEEEDNE